MPEIPQDANLDVNVPEGHDDGDLRMIRGGVGNPKLGSERSNQLLDEDELFAKVTKDFTAQHWRREESAAERETLIGGRIRVTTPWHEAPTSRRKRGFF
jgi:hypothetical protein